MRGDGERRPEQPRSRRIRPSLALQILLLFGVFLLVPLVVYNELANADAQKRALVLASVQRQGSLIAQALQPLLAQSGDAPLPTLARDLQRFATVDAQVRVLLAPVSGPTAGSFYFVAAAPERSPGMLQSEREQLERLGVLERFADACSGGLPSAVRFRAAEGREDVVTSVTPVRGPAGCWAIVVTHDYAGSTGALLGQEFWESREIKVALAIYIAMALIILSVFGSLWLALTRFARRAREIAEHGPTAESFEERNPLPELSGVAREFDRMVERLRASAAAIRRAAEDNLHAFKTPIAVIRQSVEPLDRIIQQDRGRRSLDLIEKSLDRLDELVVQMKRLDEATADLIDAPLGELDVSATLERLLAGYQEMLRQRGLAIDSRIDRRLVAHASADLFETAVENVLDNAIDFSPTGGRIQVRMSRQGGYIEVVITDQGPGIDPGDKIRIFERYYSTRGGPAGRADETHFGLGLSIVRRNVEVMGGTVGVENAEPRGLRVAIRLLVAEKS
jgi:two-component system, OmpR family, sensor histidine kinase ChvG